MTWHGPAAAPALSGTLNRAAFQPFPHLTGCAALLTVTITTLFHWHSRGSALYKLIIKSDKWFALHVKCIKAVLIQLDTFKVAFYLKHSLNYFKAELPVRTVYVE